MTKKSLRSFVTHTIYSLVCLASMHLMLLANVNKYVGVGVGLGILVIGTVLCFPFIMEHRMGHWILIFSLVSAIGCGIAMSSLYVFWGKAPSIPMSLCIWGAYSVLFLIYLLLSNIPIFKQAPLICLLIYAVLVLLGGIFGVIFSSKVIFSLVLMTFVPFAFHLATILAKSRNAKRHSETLAGASFGALFAVVILVLFIITEGDSGEWFEPFALAVGDERGTNKNYPKDPYDYKSYR